MRRRIYNLVSNMPGAQVLSVQFVVVRISLIIQRYVSFSQTGAVIRSGFSGPLSLACGTRRQLSVRLETEGSPSKHNEMVNLMPGGRLNPRFTAIDSILPLMPLVFVLL